MKLLLKGIIVGIGGIVPGLSGSVLMVIMGLYNHVIQAIATLFTDFKKNFFYLLPIVSGILMGIILFSKGIHYSLTHFEIQTRLLFFGLLIGTIPLFYKEVNKHHDLNKNHYLLMLLSFILGLYFLTFTNNANHHDLNFFQAFILGFIGISATIVPGIDGASILSALNLYDSWLDLTSLNHLNLNIYIPAGVGIIAGALILSNLINSLIKKNYNATFSVLFGFFLSVIPSILKTSNDKFILFEQSNAFYIGFILFLVGILFSYLFSKIKKE